MSSHIIVASDWLCLFCTLGVFVQHRNLLRLVPYYIWTSQDGWRLHICPLHFQLICTLQLLSNYCTPNSIINVITRYTRAEMCFFVGIHSTKRIQLVQNLNTHMTLFTHVIHSSMNFIFLSPLNHENLCHCFLISSLFQSW